MNVVFVLTVEVGNFGDQGLAKRQLVPIIADTCALRFFMRVESTCGVNEKQFVSKSTFL